MFEDRQLPRSSPGKLPPSDSVRARAVLALTGLTLQLALLPKVEVAYSSRRGRLQRLHNLSYSRVLKG